MNNNGVKALAHLNHKQSLPTRSILLEDSSSQASHTCKMTSNVELVNS
jgi:hypothetical protein